MNALSEEAARLIESLPPEKAQALIEYARYLAEKSDDEEWDRKLRHPKYSAKLKTVVENVEKEIKAGRASPFDPGRL